MGGGPWRTVARFGREFDHIIDPKTGAAHKRLLRDTALKPGEPRVLNIDASGPLTWRLVFHYGSEFDERNSGLPDAVLYETVASGTTY